MKNKLLLLILGFSIFLNASTNTTNKAFKDYSKNKVVITKYILKKNPKVSYKKANMYADTIIKESVKRGHSPYVQAALLSSESLFNADPKHAISNVIGMGGVYWSIWKKDLIRNGIAYSKDELRNPITGIKASAYVLSIYMKQHNSPRVALSYYKGYSALGKKQANDVMRIVNTLKNNEKLS